MSCRYLFPVRLRMVLEGPGGPQGYLYEALCVTEDGSLKPDLFVECSVEASNAEEAERKIARGECEIVG